jgi:hypothetical protein
MKTVMVRYKLKPDRVAENEALVRAVYEELERTQPDSFHYATFRLEDGVSFVHVAASDGENGSPLQALEAFKRFTAEIGNRCEEPPVATTVHEIASYRFFGGRR